MKAHSVTALQATPAFLGALLKYNLSEVKSLRKVISVGAALSMKLVREWHSSTSKVDLFNMYGASESGCTMFKTDPTIALDLSPTGWPQPFCSVMLVDDDLL